MKRLSILIFLLPLALFGGSMRITNDSPFVLEATILGADGSNLFSIVLKPQEVYQWYQAPSSFSDLNYQTLTPYTVIWRCNNDGTEFGITTNVPQAGAVFAQSAPDGKKICKIPKKKNQDSMP